MNPLEELDIFRIWPGVGTDNGHEIFGDRWTCFGKFAGRPPDVFSNGGCRLGLSYQARFGHKSAL